MHGDVRASAVMTDDNDDDADVGNLDDTHIEILGVSSRVPTSLDLDLAFGQKGGFTENFICEHQQEKRRCGPACSGHT